MFTKFAIVLAFALLMSGCVWNDIRDIPNIRADVDRNSAIIQTLTRTYVTNLNTWAEETSYTEQTWQELATCNFWTDCDTEAHAQRFCMAFTGSSTSIPSGYTYAQTHDPIEVHYLAQVTCSG